MTLVQEYEPRRALASGEYSCGTPKANSQSTLEFKLFSTRFRLGQKTFDLRAVFSLQSLT